MKSSTKFMEFLKKYGYWLVLALALVVLVSIVSLSIATSTKVNLDPDNNQPSQPAGVDEISFAMPVTSGNVVKEYSNSALQYKKTLNL